MFHNEEKQIAWQNEQKELEVLFKDGAQNYFTREFPDLKHAFLQNLNCVVCMDEGTAHKDVNGMAKFCLAGSGILFPAQNEDERVKKVAELFIKLGIKNISSHGGCGAAGLAYKRDFPDKKEVKAEELEEYAKNWSKKVVEEIQRQNNEAEHFHMVAEEMERPVEFHIARVVYYDAVGGFNSNKEVGLPVGFIIERRFVPVEYALNELKVAIKIVFGNHGFGELFTKENPFVIIILAGATELESIKKEITEAIKDDKNFIEEKIKIDGMVI